MILALPTYVNCKDMSLFKGQENIVYDEEATLTIDNPLPGKYNISWKCDISDLIKEAWAVSMDGKIILEKSGVGVPIIIMGNDPELQPFSMKDRLVFLQDQLNKGKLNV